MKLNTLFTVFAVVVFVYGVAGVLATGFLLSLHWPNRIGPEAYFLGQGWGSTLLGLVVIAWVNRRITDVAARKATVLGMFVFFILLAILWFVDALAWGWSFFSILTFGLIILFTLWFGFFLFVRPEEG